MEQEIEHKKRLEEIRNGDNTDKNMPVKNSEEEKKKNEKSAISSVLKEKKQGIKEAISLAAYLNPFTDWMFGIALAMAALKDIFDYFGIIFFGIGWLITFMASVLIFFTLLLAGASSKKNNANSLVKKYGTLAGGTAMELVLGINFLPIQTITVIITFILTLKERQDNDR